MSKLVPRTSRKSNAEQEARRVRSPSLRVRPLWLSAIACRVRIGISSLPDLSTLQVDTNIAGAREDVCEGHALPEPWEGFSHQMCDASRRSRVSRRVDDGSVRLCAGRFRSRLVAALETRRNRRTSLRRSTGMLGSDGGDWRPAGPTSIHRCAAGGCNENSDQSRSRTRFSCERTYRRRVRERSHAVECPITHARCL